MDRSLLCVLLIAIWTAGQVTVVKISGAAALRMSRVKVPDYVLLGEAYALQCLFELGADRLYSVTWYKDHEEFYRYVPRSVPPQHVYRLEGIAVDDRKSGAQQVVLQHAQLSSAGYYSCEVSAEAPSFVSVVGGGKLQVVALAKNGPQITAEKREYQMGDVIDLNCSSGKSYPATRLHWFINDQPVGSDRESTVVQQGLMGSMAGLHVRLEPRHLEQGMVEVRCLATVGSEGTLPLLDSREALLLVRAASAVTHVQPTVALLSTALCSVLLSQATQPRLMLYG